MQHRTPVLCLGLPQKSCVKIRDIPFLFQSNSALSELIGAEHSQETQSGGQCRGCC